MFGINVVGFGFAHCTSIKSIVTGDYNWQFYDALEKLKMIENLKTLNIRYSGLRKWEDWLKQEINKGRDKNPVDIKLV